MASHGLVQRRIQRQIIPVGQHTGSEYHLVVTAESLLDPIFVDPVDGQIVYFTRTIQRVTTLYRLEESTGSFCQLFTIDWAEEDKSRKPLITEFTGRNGTTLPYVTTHPERSVPGINSVSPTLQ